MSPILWVDPLPDPPHEPRVCPYCGSTDVETVELPTVKRIGCMCNCCGKSWSEKA